MKAPIGWMQLRHRPLRLLVAITGIGFAVLLVLMQIGFRGALFESTTRYHERFRYDIALFSVDSSYFVLPELFSIRRLYQALGDRDVASVSPVYIRTATLRNPWSHERRRINAIGFRPADDVLATEGMAENLMKIERQDALLLDSDSRPEFSPLVEELRRSGSMRTEVNNRQVDLVGLFTMGPSFGIDGALITSDDNFLRLYPDHAREDISLGLIRLHSGVAAEEVKDRLEALLPDDVLVLTKTEFIAREQAYWNSATPVGYVFAFGALMGLVVGAIIVYQILFADVSDHLAEYATLRAMGFSKRFVYGVVLQQAAILSVLGFIPGAFVSWRLYLAAGAATQLPLALTQERLLMVFLLILGLCVVSALLALDKVRRLDPADVF